MDIDGVKTLSLDDFTGRCHACSRNDGLGSRWHAVGQKCTETVERKELLFIHFEDSHAFRTMILMSVLIAPVSLVDARGVGGNGSRTRELGEGGDSPCDDERRD